METPAEWTERKAKEESYEDNTEDKPKRKAHRTALLTKYGREVMILEMAEMILNGTPRSEIVNTIHTKYNYSIVTINDLISEANKVASKQFDPEHVRKVARKIDNLYDRTISSELERTGTKLYAADLWAKLHSLYKPEVAVQINNITIFKKLDDQKLKEIGDIIGDKYSE